MVVSIALIDKPFHQWGWCGPPRFMQPGDTSMSRFARSFLAFLALGASAPALAGPLADGDKMAIMADVDRGADALAKNALQIWNYAKSAFRRPRVRPCCSSS